LLDDRCVEVLDFDQAGPVEGAGGQPSNGDGSTADYDLGELAESSTIRSTRAMAADQGPISVLFLSPGPTTTCMSRSSKCSRT
jgi:hypothetical protein